MGGGRLSSGSSAELTSKVSELELRLDRASVTAPVELKSYRVLRRVGAGGMGVVYEARDGRDHPVAIKILRGRGSRYLSRLKEEFRSVADVSHENLAAVYELAFEGADPYLAMEFVSGCDLTAHLQRAAFKAEQTLTTIERGLETLDGQDAALTATIDGSANVAPVRTLDLDALKSALVQLARGVHALHAAGRIHRDLKPSNVLVDKSGRVVVVDFGLACDRSDARDDSSLAGTPAYMAPEQARGEPALTASDWYAFGVILYELLTRRLPLTGTMSEVLLLKQRVVPPKPSTFAEGIPPELDALAMSLMAIDPNARPTGEDVLATLGSRVSLPPTHDTNEVFIGRAAELAELQGMFGETVRGGCRALWIHGASGIGKSALLEHFVEQVRAMEPETLLFSGRCYACETVPYKAFDGVVEQLSRELERRHALLVGEIPQRELQDLTSMFPALARVFGPHDSSTATAALSDTVHVSGGDLVRDPTACRASAFRGLKRILRVLGEYRPVLVAVDDLQWADIDSALLLRELLAAPDAPRLFFVGLYRTTEADSPFLREVFASLPQSVNPAASTIELAPLSSDEARSLAERWFGGTSASAIDFEAVAREAAGHPYFIEEYVRFTRRKPSTEPRHVSALDDVLLERVSELSRDARHLLAVVCVAGAGIPIGVAGEAAGLRSSVTPTLHHLTKSSLLRMSGPRDQDRVEAYHDRIRESVVNALDPSTRTDVHLSLAVTLEQQRADPELLAHHFIAGGKNERGAFYAVDAAHRSERALAFGHAANLYALALGAVSHSADERRKLSLRRADALVNAGRCGEAAPIYIEAARDAQPAEHIDLLRKAAEQLLVAGQVEDGLRVLERVLAELGVPTPRSTTQVMLRTSVALTQLAARHLLPLPLTPSSAEFTAEDASRLRACFTASRGISAYDLVRGVYFSVETLRLALLSPDVASQARSLAAVGSMLAYGGAPAMVKVGARLLDRAMELARSTGDVAVVANVDVHSGITRMTAGAWRDTLRILEPALATLSRCAGHAHERGYGEMTVIFALEAMGRLREVGWRADACLREGNATGNLYLRVQAHLYLALVSISEGRVDDALTHERVIEEWPPASRGFLFQHWLALKVALYRELYMRRPDSAMRRLDAAWGALSDSGLFSVQFLRVSSLSLRGLTLTHLAAVDRAARSRLLDRAVADADALEGDGSIARAAAATIRAAVLGQRGDIAAARAQRLRAHAIFTAQEMALHAAAIPGFEDDRALLLAREGVADIDRYSSLLAGCHTTQPS
ncbi:MAG: protein kinase [Polyangiaceae bacterium]